MEESNMYRIMFSDLDETLLVNHHVPKVNQEAIFKAREKGLKFVPCTGRAFNMIPEILKEIGTYDQEEEYSLCFNGGLIVENKNNKILHFKGLEFDIAKKIFENARNLDVCVLVFTLDCCYIFHADENEIERKIAQKAKFEVIEDYNLDFLKDEKIAKILYEKRDMDFLKSLETKLPQSIKETCSVAFSSGRYMEMNTKDVDKGYGMRWLVNYLGYDMDETIGIGDNYNDVEMIKTAKLGCAVACANDDIKELAQYVTEKDYDEGAVSEVVEKFILGENHE
jgi:Cof subfamily protein (haloacid dehalogenase superfamily)